MYFKSKTFSPAEKFHVTFATLIVIILLSYTPTPVQEIHDKALKEAGIQLLVKREDLNNQYCSGNKWWKLKYNLWQAAQEKKFTLLTFGGAYSNHIFSTAAAAHELGFKSIGIIRGEETLPLNHTLSFAKKCGMHIHYCSRDEYLKKNDEEFIISLNKEFGEFYLIPEGGSNELGVKGCETFAKTFLNTDEIKFDYLCVAVGTGATLAGIIEGMLGQKKIIGFAVLKGAAFLEKEIKGFLSKSPQAEAKNWQLELSYHFGGYAKATPALLEFIKQMGMEHNLPLDHVYTGKLMYAILDYSRQGRFKRGSTVLMLHTGGLQGSLLL